MAKKGRQRSLVTGTALLICLISLIWSALPVSGDSAQTVSKNQSGDLAQKRIRKTSLARENHSNPGASFCSNAVFP